MARPRRKGQPSIEELVGPLEAASLRALWRDAPASVGDVLERVNAGLQAKLAYTTVMTVLSRLHDKGLVTRERQGRGYDYRPAYAEVELVDVLSHREVDRVVARYGDAALAQFMRALEDTDPELLRRVRALTDGTSADA